MTTMVNPIEAVTSLLRPSMPGVYLRQMIYDPTWADQSYTTYVGQRIIPVVGSVVQDTDGVPLWVTTIDPVTYVPTYNSISFTTSNDNVVSLLDYGNSLFRLYVDSRALPYAATPDSKCIFIGKSPRFYTLSRYPNTPQETIISQYFDATGTLISQMIPLIALDNTNTSWYLPRTSIIVSLADNEEVQAKIYDESGNEVYSAMLFAKQSSVINEDIMYSPMIVGMTITGTQKLANGNFYLYEKQNFNSLGLSVTLVYSDGSTASVPIDGVKCFMYGQTDFISSFAGLTQFITIKYFRSSTENISPGLADPTGSMITMQIPVIVVPNGLNTTSKISVVPYYNSFLNKYTLRYFIYFGNGSNSVDITAYVTIILGNVVTDSSQYGTAQNYTISIDMNNVNPVTYATSTTYTQNVVITFYPQTSLVKYSVSDSPTAQNIYGLDNATTRRPLLKYDSTRDQYFVPTNVFANVGAFLQSFYYSASPPYDPTIAQIPQTPTHFVVRDMMTGVILISGPIPIASYGTAFNVIEAIAGNHNNTTVVFEFINAISTSAGNVLYGVPVDVSSGTYI